MIDDDLCLQLIVFTVWLESGQGSDSIGCDYEAGTPKKPEKLKDRFPS